MSWQGASILHDSRAAGTGSVPSGAARGASGAPGRRHTSDRNGASTHGSDHAANRGRRRLFPRGGRAGAGAIGVTLDLFLMALFGLIVVALLLVLAAGVISFQSIRDDRTVANATRLDVSLVTNAVRAADARGAVSVQKGPAGDVLVITEHTAAGDFETRFFLDNGWLVEEYAVAGTPLGSTQVQRVSEAASFDAEVGHSSVRIQVDGHVGLVALRSDDAVNHDCVLEVSAGEPADENVDKEVRP